MALGSTAFLESSICAVSYNTSKVFPKNVKGWIKGGCLKSEQRKEEREMRWGMFRGTSREMVEVTFQGTLCYPEVITATVFLI